MLVPISWLKKYVPITIPSRELAHRLTMAGTEVGNIVECGETWAKDKIIVGHVLSVDPHPDADRLKLPSIDLGNGEIAKVVCGGPNLAPGQKIAFAREGASLFNTRSGRIEVLKAAKIRGIVSAGMVCSERELGIGEDHNGILVLDDNAPLGTPLVDYIGDSILELELTPNRPDCLSMLGVAHEVAALTGQQVTEPSSSYQEEGRPIQDQVKIQITDSALCNRYAANLVSGVTVGPSPKWMRDALSSIGQRSINNIVDATNYVMLEYGQPLHAFDFGKVNAKSVVVRTAQPNEEILTLDGESFKLKPPMLVIADSKDPIALAGVIGGMGTSVTDKTTTVLLESANFDASNTRLTRTDLGITTEASYRFERNLRAELVPLALQRLTRIILDVAGGSVARGTIDLYPHPKQLPPVSISLSRIRKVLGVDLDMSDVEHTLAGLGFSRSTNADTPSESLNLKVPYWRSDISIEDDLIEEVARIIGYDSIPTTMLSAPIPHHKPRPLMLLRETLRDKFTAAGIQETISYSATSLRSLKAVKSFHDSSPPVKIANPLSTEFEYMKVTLRSGVLETLSYNHRNSRGRGIKIFEIGRVYLPTNGAAGPDLPEEKEMLLGVMTGPRIPLTWLATEAKLGFFDAKGLLESIMASIGTSATYKPLEDPILYPDRTAGILCNQVRVGVIGEVRQEILSYFELGDDPVVLFELDIESLFNNTQTSEITYSNVSRFPDSERDLALLIDSSVPSENIQSIINRHQLVSTSIPFDLYYGERIPKGKKSLAFRIVFQSSKATLTADQVDEAQEVILHQLQREFDAELRE